MAGHGSQYETQIILTLFVELFRFLTAVICVILAYLLGKTQGRK